MGKILFLVFISLSNVFAQTNTTGTGDSPEPGIFTSELECKKKIKKIKSSEKDYCKKFGKKYYGHNRFIKFIDKKIFLYELDQLEDLSPALDNEGCDCEPSSILTSIYQVAEPISQKCNIYNKNELIKIKKLIDYERSTK